MCYTVLSTAVLNDSTVQLNIISIHINVTREFVKSLTYMENNKGPNIDP